MTNQTEQERILARVAKMLALGNNDGATEGERDNALRMAHATLAKYNLDISQAEAVSSTKVNSAASTEPRERNAEVYLGVLWARQIAMAVGKLFFCHYHYSKVPRNQHKARHIFIGKHSNVVTAQGMAQYLIQSVHREAQAYANRVSGDYSCYRSFATAAMMKINERCEKLREDSNAPAPTVATPGTSLVLADVYKREDEANRMFLVAQGVKLVTRKARSARYNGEALQAGAIYGAKVSLNRQVR